MTQLFNVVWKKGEWKNYKNDETKEKRFGDTMTRKPNFTQYNKDGNIIKLWNRLRFYLKPVKNFI